MDNIKTAPKNLIPSGMEHPFKTCTEDDKKIYVNILAALVAAAEDVKINYHYVDSVLAGLGLRLDFPALVDEYRNQPERVDLVVATLFFSDSDRSVLLILDAAMIAPEIYADSQTGVWAFLQKLDLPLDPGEEGGKYDPAIFQFATALAKAEKAPDFLIGTTTHIRIETAWAHILQFKKLYTGDAKFLPELCRVFSPGEVGEMFRSNQFTTDKNGNLRLETALFYNSFKVTKFLLAKGVDVNAIDKAGETALNIMLPCIDVECLLNTEIVEWLLAHGATISSDNLSTMILLGGAEAIDFLKKNHVEVPSENIMMMLDPEEVRKYLKNGGNPHLTYDGQSWIDCAISQGFLDIAEVLREFGAKPTIDHHSFIEKTLKGNGNGHDI